MNDKQRSSTIRGFLRARLAQPSPVEWLCLFGGAILVIQYSWVMDDAYVYFRYVDNWLIVGCGLVYNHGEYVEGFSSPVWALVLALFRATGLDWWAITRLIGLLCFGSFWALLVLLNRVAVRRVQPGVPRLNLPLCFLTFNYAVASYWTSGLETPLVQVSAVVYALFVLRPTSRALQLALAVTPILRHELAVPFAMCFAWQWFRTRRFPVFTTLATIATSGVWMVFRVWYYADLFPNTFYLKDSVDIAQGLRYVHDTTTVYHVFPLLALAAAGLFLSRRVSPQQRVVPPDSADITLVERGFLVLLALPVLAYVIKIGGDPRHYRYLAFPFCLIFCATTGIWSRSGAVLLGRLRRGASFAAPAAAVVFAIWTASLVPRQLDSHPFFGEVGHRNIDLINDAAYHRDHPLLKLPAWGSVADDDLAGELRAVRARPGPHVYSDTISGAACVTTYLAFDARVVQSFGLTDAILARTKMETTKPAHKPGLWPHADWMATVIRRRGNRPFRGMYRQLVERGNAPPWVVANLDTIEVIERKMFNEHDLVENIRLALTFPGPLVVPGS